MLNGLFSRRWFMGAAPVGVAAASGVIGDISKDAMGDGVALGDQNTRLFGRSVGEFLDSRYNKILRAIEDDPAVRALSEDWNCWERRRAELSNQRYHTGGVDPEIVCLRSASLHTKQRLQLAKRERELVENASWSERLKQLKNQVARTLGLSPEELKDWS